ncbi:MAG: J domain-containing protein [Dehalococcoidia bacterium]
MAKNYYGVLGVPKNASDKDIRSAYRRLARQYHPDVNPEDAASEAKFKEINEAYQVLSKPEDRKKYDQFGENWKYADQYSQAGAGAGAGQQGSPYTWFTRGGGRRRGGQSRAGGEGLGDLLGDLLGGGARTRMTMEDFPPQPVEVPVTVTLEEAYNGAKRKVQAPGDPLSGAPGRTLEVDIPAGVQSNSRVHIGVPNGGGGPPLDINLRITVAPHPVFERKVDDLLTTVNVPLLDAVLGGEVEVPAITGRKVALKVPPGTQNGRVFRLKGKGMPRRNAPGAHGDLLASVKVVLPESLTDEQRDLFQRLKESGIG